ncbi:MAG: Tim44-like domain-containing protein, partial [Desulfovibrionaceae bacterium]|nr:Tim44-like domain-containing protein [Desulfovibrionaceae bacterium]
QNTQYSNTGSAWDNLRGGQAGGMPGAGSVSMSRDIPAGFDEEGFIKGAKMAYTRMQASWDKRDLEDISHFAYDDIMRELSRQMAEDPNPGRTEIVMLNATLISVREFGSLDLAQVYFDALLIEDPRQTQPTNARELWTFAREHGSGNWKLYGLQQIEGN